MKRTLLSFLIILCTALAVQAQPAPVYTLKSCLEQGLLNNYSLRITRNESMQSLNVKGLFPAGEGAGYAGGIVSAAIDGERCAEGVAGYLSLV